MLPLADHNPRRTTPVVNYLLIAANILVFLWEMSKGRYLERALFEVAFIPARFWYAPFHPLNIMTMFVSMFLHGGLLHLGGNMLYLWIFGDNIEDRLGHVKYVIFYLLCGVIASLSHVFVTAAFAGTQDDMLVPSLGASGAISGVLGGYILLHPSRRVTVILFRFLTDVPAWVAIGIWFAFQLISGLGMLGGGSQTGGVAYAAHVGGFLAGLVLIKFFDRGHAGTRV